MKLKHLLDQMNIVAYGGEGGRMLVDFDLKIVTAVSIRVPVESVEIDFVTREILIKREQIKESTMPRQPEDGIALAGPGAAPPVIDEHDQLEEDS